MKCYVIDLDRHTRKQKPEVMELSGEELVFDMDAFNASSVLDLNNYDRRVFKTEAEAEIWLEKYLELYYSLDNRKIRKIKGGGLPYKRRYLVQTLLGEKNHTVRSYRKNWENGKLFNLNDQTFFLTVQLKSIKQIGDEYRYEFRVV